jgi:hypothetical protein
MRALFLFLRVVASLISMSFVLLGALYAGLAVWLIWQLPRTGAGIGGLIGMAGFGLVMLSLGVRVLREQARMALSWWRQARRERLLPQARLVLR